MKYLFLIFAFIAVCFFQRTYAIKCYQCNLWPPEECIRADKVVDCDLQPKPSNTIQYKPVTNCRSLYVEGDEVKMIDGCHFVPVGQSEDDCDLPDDPEVHSCMLYEGVEFFAGSSRFAAAGLMTLLAFVVAKFLL